MDGRGQMFLLSALIVCLCLILLTACLTSIRTVEASEEPSLEKDALDNVIWAMDEGMKQKAGEVGGASWEGRQCLAADFKGLSDGLIDDASRGMQKRGVAFYFTYDDALAEEYLNDSDNGEVEHIDGILMKKEGAIARICGCTYTVTLADGSAQYSASKVIVWS